VAGSWALRGATGAGYTHNITSLLAGTPLAGGTFTYTVINIPCGFGTADAQCCKTVRFNLVYADEQP
jgi:hypothetical protein